MNDIKIETMRKDIGYFASMGKWINNHTVINKEIEKPCHELNYCPYGQLVEVFECKEKADKYSCKAFGHDCPVFYHYEDIRE